MGTISRQTGSLLKGLAVLGLAVILTSCTGVKLPDVSQMTPTGVRVVQCPDGSKMEWHIYSDKDGNQFVTYQRGEKVLALHDVEKNQIYVYKDKQAYTFEEIVTKYKTACDLPE